MTHLKNSKKWRRNDQFSELAAHRPAAPSGGANETDRSVERENVWWTLLLPLNESSAKGCPGSFLFQEDAYGSVLTIVGVFLERSEAEWN